MRERQEHPLDADIMREHFKRDLVNIIGLSSVDLDKAKLILSEVVQEIESEAAEYPTFDSYWCSF